jgi:hypothetical protein
VILHRERANKGFEKHSTWLLNRFFKFIITARLPLHRASADHCRLQCTVVQTEWHLRNSTVVKEEEASFVLLYLIMYYMLNLVICIGMILLDLLQCLICTVVINLSSIFDSTAVWICNSLFMFMIYFFFLRTLIPSTQETEGYIYFWIKIKLKVLLFPTLMPSTQETEG